MRDRGRKVWILTLEIKLNIRNEMACIKWSIVLRTRYDPHRPHDRNFL